MSAPRRSRRGGFRRRDASAVYDLHFGPNMTPMVDVVLVILIFFMASTALIGSELLLRSGVPSRTASPTTVESLLNAEPVADAFDLEPPTLVVRVRTGDGRVVCDGFGLTGVDVVELEARAAEIAGELRSSGAITGDRDGDVAVVVEVGDGVPYEGAVRTQDALVRAGFVRVGMR